MVAVVKMSTMISILNCGAHFRNSLRFPRLEITTKTSSESFCTSQSLQSYRTPWLSHAFPPVVVVSCCRLSCLWWPLWRQDGGHGFRQASGYLGGSVPMAGGHSETDDSGDDYNEVIIRQFSIRPESHRKNGLKNQFLLWSHPPVPLLWAYLPVSAVVSMDMAEWVVCSQASFEIHNRRFRSEHTGWAMLIRREYNRHSRPGYTPKADSP